MVRFAQETARGSVNPSPSGNAPYRSPGWGEESTAGDVPQKRHHRYGKKKSATIRVFAIDRFEKRLVGLVANLLGMARKLV